MIRGLAILAALTMGLVGVPAHAKSPHALLQDGNVRVRVSTQPGRQVLIGQQTRFFVEILTDTWFTTAPDYPELVLDGAVALMPEQMGTNFTERIGGETFAAQRRSYVIFPQRAGPLEIPSLRIRLAVSQEGRAGTPFTLRTRPLKLNVVLPAEAEGIEGLVTTPRLRVREEWSRPLEDLKVGDAIQRTVRMDADRALGMLLPDLEFDAPAGVATYPDQARTEDQVNRGQYQGRRVETVTYVLQKPGEFVLPEIRLHWWSPHRGALSVETLEARTLEVSGDPDVMAVAPEVATPWWANWRREVERLWNGLRDHAVSLLVGSVAFLVLLALLRRVLPALFARLEDARLRRTESEVQIFRTLRKSAGRGDLDALFRDFWRWRERISAEIPELTHETLQRTAKETGFDELWSDVERARYGSGHSPSSGRDLRVALETLRRTLLSQRRKAEPEHTLFALNPRRDA